ncbi:hypothetical protein WME99_34305 [Sorangium sp. So ce136]|uniref:hypothetical protein n=1 Tax=Sorangium sp. So ce136 TaxID=3133284 RepID=UPI003F108AF4
MRPLPASRYDITDWKHAKVNIDCCACHDDRRYSAPYALARVEIRATRSYGRKVTAVIVDEHRPYAPVPVTPDWRPRRSRTGVMSAGIRSGSTDGATGYGG